MVKEQVQDRDTYNQHQQRGWRLREGKIEVVKKSCPVCGHHKMFVYPRVDAVISRKCTKCAYVVYR